MQLAENNFLNCCKGLFGQIDVGTIIDIIRYYRPNAIPEHFKIKFVINSELFYFQYCEPPFFFLLNSRLTSIGIHIYTSSYLNFVLFKMAWSGYVIMDM